MTSALPIGIEPQQSIDGIESYRLSSNGLNILLIPTQQQPIATVMVTHKVGARNEVAGTTGATHILEHMLFKGTERFNAENGLDYSAKWNALALALMRPLILTAPITIPLENPLTGTGIRGRPDAQLKNPAR